ncbi:polymerase [Stagonosporopsis vannaccii]|nr:polymerase [Stagonosporopsis vannaccii]
MPRRQFVADLAAAVEGVSIAGISNVRAGGDDGEFVFMCIADGCELQISALIPELADYPSSHECMIFGPDNASASIASTLAGISANRKTVHQILELVSRELESTDRDGDHQMLSSQDYDGLHDGFDIDEESEEEYFPGDEDLMPRTIVTGSKTLVTGIFTEPTTAFRQRVRRDLLAAKNCGFKVGHLGGLADGLSCYVAISIRIARLGISEEAMRAWQLKPKEYLVTLIYYPAGYKSMDDIRSYDNSQAQSNFAMRLGICKSYKPTLQEAVQAFAVLSKEDKMRCDQSQQKEDQRKAAVHQGFRHSFISRPLNELLAQRFHLLLKYRYAGMDWNGAELYYNDQVLQPMSSRSECSEDKYYAPEKITTAYPSLVTADHIQQSTSQEHSLPTVGMQFVLRHFVRCTEFCLICFSKMTDDLQAIKPYVCDNPLCLYQYMSLGFGTSIEHEVLSQPKVVDLLISFCYSAARHSQLKDFPAGLALMVPPCSSYEGEYPVNHYHGYGMQPQPAPPLPQKTSKSREFAPTAIRLNLLNREILFEDKSEKCPLRLNDWITFRFDDDPSKSLHCRILETAYYPIVKISEPIEPTTSTVDTNPHGWNTPLSAALPAAATKLAPPGLRNANEFRPAKFQIYNQNFDELSEQNKRQVICLLLDLLPPVNDMKHYLIGKAQASLSTWKDRLCPAALGLLRWIIASNRACILQVDTDDDIPPGRKAEDRLYGMSNWVQFRFAMGAPDKERRFVGSVRSVTDRLRLKFPTLFAWHGSPLHNWHSIIREGLHFKETHHGRAFGHGVYHSLDVNTSIGYSGYGGIGYTWPNSELKVQQALALNEICNAPQEFVSKTPHLVVAQLDWIQTRYLFVSSATRHQAINPADKGSRPLEVLEQDPSMTPMGSDGKLVVPVHAVARSRRPKSLNTTQHKRRKANGTSLYEAIDIDIDDTDSVTTLDEDLRMLEDDDEQFNISLPTPSLTKDGTIKSKLGGFFQHVKDSETLTDYVPGTLDYNTLPMLQQPSWASSAATKCLMRDFNALIKTQNEQPMHELGWHIDEDRIENVYQWIAELHSFDPMLPLAQDMKRYDLKSVVLELRFGKDYPMAPPFVRVIRPRFISFAAGGGGHVTAGGAMCMELLTNDGWSAASSIESVLVQVRMAMTSLDPRPARLERSGRRNYGIGEAVEAYIRACAMHGWTVPADFKETAYGGVEGLGHLG